jgi:hypothetical protein
MKLLPYVVLNVFLVAAGIFVYDQLRNDGPAPAAPAGVQPVDLGGIEARLAALEAQREPLLRAQGSDASLLQRLEALEGRFEAARPASAPGADAEDPERPSPTPAASASKDDPTPEAVARFRKLQEYVNREERARVQRGRIMARIAKLGIRLTAKQQERLVQAYVAFQPRVSEIWGEAKTRAMDDRDEVDWPTVIAETTVVIQQEFTQQVSSFITAPDAEAIAGALYARGK